MSAFVDGQNKHGGVYLGPNPATARGVASQLDANKQGTKLAYTMGRIVVVRDVQNPGLTEVYRQHKAETTVARFAPNGNYIASGDTSGRVRMWAYDHPEQLLKKEVQMGGAVVDIAWGPEGKRVCAVGAGKINAKAFMFPTGSSQGEVVGHSKKVLSCAFKPTRPYRLATSSEDFKVNFFQGPPFKFALSQRAHTNFVQCVRYAPNGELFASVSNDKKIILYDGKDGSIKGELPGPKEHKGSIYSLSWSPDSAHLITASGDKTVKLWDVAAGTCTASMQVAARPQVGDMQVACVYAGQQIVSLSLNGNLNYLDPSSEGPVRVVQAHSSPPLSMAVDRNTGRLFTGATGGDVCAWNGDSATRLGGVPHRSRAVGVAVAGGNLYSVGWDDCLRTARVADEGAVEYAASSVALGGQPKAVAASSGGLVAVVTNTGVKLVRDGATVATLNTDFDSNCVDFSPDGAQLAVGGSDKMVHLYNVGGDALNNAGTAYGPLRASVESVAFSPDGKYLVAGDRQKYLKLWDRATGESLDKNRWCFHQSSVGSLAWTPDSKMLASGSVDAQIIVWDPSDVRKKIKIPFAHMGGVTGLAWSDNQNLTSCGADGCVRRWAPQW